MSRHCSVRMQQRRIPPLVLDILRLYGRMQRRYGATLYFLDKKGRRLAASYLGRAAAGHVNLDAYMIEADDGAVITVGYRRRRFPSL